MPPKKKKGSAKQAKKKSSADSDPPVRSLYGPDSGNDNVEKLLLEKLVTRADLVFVRLKQVDWAYSDFTVMVHATAPLYTLCRKIEEKHGRMASDPVSGQTTLQLFRHPPNEKNIIHPADWHLRLDQLGMTGGTVEEQHQAIIYFNYVPAASTALLQREPQLIMLPRISVEEHELHEQQQARHNDADFVEASSPSSSSSAFASGHGSMNARDGLHMSSMARTAVAASAAAAAAASSKPQLSLNIGSPRTSITATSSSTMQ